MARIFHKGEWRKRHAASERVKAPDATLSRTRLLLSRLRSRPLSFFAASRAVTPTRTLRNNKQFVLATDSNSRGSRFSLSLSRGEYRRSIRQSCTLSSSRLSGELQAADRSGTSASALRGIFLVSKTRRFGLGIDTFVASFDLATIYTGLYT